MHIWRPFVFAVVLTAASITSAWAQPWPSQPIKLVVPLPPGGAYDYIARMLADRLLPALGVPVVVENKPGGSAQIGTAFVARAPADGSTFIVVSNTHVILPSLFSSLPYDAIKDFEPIGMIVKTPFVLVVTPKIPAYNVRDYVAIAKARPGSLEYGSSGIGSPFHLAAELMKSMTGIDLLHVPYRGAAPLIQALLAQDIASAFVPIGPFLPHIQEGKLRALAAVDPTRSAILPDLPTIAEALPLPGYGLNSWFGILAPAGTPRAIVDRMNKEIASIVADKRVGEQLLAQGYEAVGSTPAALEEVMKQDLAMYSKLVRDAKIPAQ